MNTLGIQRSLRNSRDTGYQNSGSMVLFVQILKKKFCGYSEKVSKKKWAASICIFCLSPALLPLDTEVHAHGDGKLLVIDGEDVQNLHVNIDIDGAIRDRGLELLVVQGQAPAKDTF